MAGFTVDTHLFRELGELLVGRDSTALVELIKNAYDADASQVTVVGERLDDPANGRIQISDDGNGMTAELFKRGFLRIASRIKEEGNRRSELYKRRFTGAKGVGRLAAHKLAKFMTVQSVFNAKLLSAKGAASPKAITATIDWAKLEGYETLDQAEGSDAVTLKQHSNGARHGTDIELTRLRRKWTPSERARVIREVTTFQPPGVLLNIPPKVHSEKLLFAEPLYKDVQRRARDPGFDVRLLGDFEGGEEYWSVVAEVADWILEIEADRQTKAVRYLITPTNTCRRNIPDAEQHEFTWDEPELENLASLQARILIREGGEGIQKSQRQWLVDSAGIKVYMEGFRVLPYGEPGDDWLEIDSDYTKRLRTLRYLDAASIDLGSFAEGDKDAPLNALRNQSYYGAAFLTRQGNPELEMVVNREGFIDNAAFRSLQRIIRVGIDLSVRVRAYENQLGRDRWRRERRERAPVDDGGSPPRFKMREEAEAAVQKAMHLVGAARTAAAAGRNTRAGELITSSVKELERSVELAGELVTDRSMMQILAGVGLQMSAFVHEINGLLGMASAVEKAVDSLRRSAALDQIAKRELGPVHQSIEDLRRVVERQASYLSDITSPDARRRKSKQYLSERFDAALKLVERVAEQRAITIESRIPDDLKSPKMFPAELMVVFSNLLTNAIKACGRKGRVRSLGRLKADGSVVLRVENTGKRIRLEDAEKWFLPFKSTTAQADPMLGQGMGMGLPIARNILEEYAARIYFVRPSHGFATAIEIVFP